MWVRAHEWVRGQRWVFGCGRWELTWQSSRRAGRAANLRATSLASPNLILDNLNIQQVARLQANASQRAPQTSSQWQMAGRRHLLNSGAPFGFVSLGHPCAPPSRKNA